QLLRKAFQTCSRLSSCQPGSEDHDVWANLPASARGGVSRMDCKDGTTKGLEAISGAPVSAGLPPEVSSRGRLVQEASRASKLAENRSLFMKSPENSLSGEIREW